MEALFAAQRWIQDVVSRELSSYAASGDPFILAEILPLGILFGSIHALTPGHSKTVLASYIVGSRLAYLRGIAVAGTLALVHVFSAVVLAFTAATLVTKTLGGVGRAPVLEDLSRGVLVLIGIWLLWRTWRARTHPRGEGLMVAFAAGLIPCPLTLFAMFLSMSRGIPEAGLAFAFAMMIGVGVTLAGVAAAAIVLRDQAVALIDRHGGTVYKVTRGLDAITGLLLVAIGVRQLFG